MTFAWVRFLQRFAAKTNTRGYGAIANGLKAYVRHWHSGLFRLGLVVSTLIMTSVWILGTPAALADLNDDRYDGNIFALYAGNGSIAPPRVSLEATLKQQKPALLVFYVDDSRDCKHYASVVSRLDAFYGRAANFIPIMADAISANTSPDPTEPGYYFKGVVPHTILFDQSGQVRLDETGELTFEQVDDVFRQVFDLLPRSESVELRRRVVNEINTELVEEPVQ